MSYPAAPLETVTDDNLALMRTGCAWEIIFGHAEESRLTLKYKAICAEIERRERAQNA